jgi:hypothetical protein
MMTRAIAAGIMGALIPERGPAVVTLNYGKSACPQYGTISGSGSTITGVGTKFVTGNPQIQVGTKIVVNNSAGSLNYLDGGGVNSVVSGTLLNVTAIASDTSLTVSQTGLAFAMKSFFTDLRTVVNINGAWKKPVSGKLQRYGMMNLQGDETLLHIPDNELNAAGNGYEIKTDDTIVFAGDTFQVTSSGTTLKTVLTDWVCVCRKVLAN